MSELDESGEQFLAQSQDRLPSAAANKQWERRKLRRRAAVAARVAAPLLVVTVLKAVTAGPEGLVHRLAISARPALELAVVLVPLGCLVAALNSVRIRSRDRQLPRPNGVLFCGAALSHRPAAAGLLLVVDDTDRGVHGLRWEPSDNARELGAEDWWIPADALAGLEMESGRPYRGDVRVNLVPSRPGFPADHLDFEILDLRRFAAAAAQSGLFGATGR